MECPELRALAIVRWQLFATHTFKSVHVGDRMRDSMFQAWIRKVSNAARVLPHTVLWCRREERGEQTDRLHFHSLIGGLPSKRIHLGSCFQFMRFWEHSGGGHARIRIFNPDLESAGDALGYTLKGLSGADSYESMKFNSGRAQLMLSRSVVKVVTSAHWVTESALDTGDKNVSTGH